MEWIRENWVFLLLFTFFIGMHLSGRGCGGHGGHGGHGNEEGDEHKEHAGKVSHEKKGGHGCC